MRYSILLFLLIMLGSCGSGRDIPANGREITLSSGNQEVIERNGPTIKVISVQDNRCPAGVQCVWEGYVTVSLAISDGTSQKVISLCSGKCEDIGAGTKLKVVLGVKAFEVTLEGVAENGDVTLRVHKI